MAENEDLDLQRLLADDLALIRKYLGPKYKKVRGAPSRRASKVPRGTQQTGEGDLTQEELEALTLQHAATAAGPSSSQQQPPPRHATTYEAASAALDANKALQLRLRRLLASVRIAQEKNMDIRQRVRDCITRRQAAQTPLNAATTTPILLGNPLGGSWFWTVPGAQAPPPNDDIPDVAAVTRYLPLAFRRTPWTDEERGRLAEGVLQLVQEKQLTMILTGLEAQVAAGGAISVEQFTQQQAPIRQLTTKSEAVYDASKQFSDDDWKLIGHRTLPGRSGTDCKLQWFNAARPTIRNEAFSPEEDRKLEQLVATHGDRNWQLISAGMNGTRTTVQCIGRWQQLLLAKSGPKEFDPQDFERLGALVKQHGKLWKRIAEDFGGNWDAKQLLHLWRKHEQSTAHAIGPRKGKWNEEEDELLRKAVALKGKKWAEVARLVPGRTDVQCRERYANCLDPSVRGEPFTDDELRSLPNLVALNTDQAGKVKWRNVARALPGRTDDQVRKQWGRMKREEENARRALAALEAAAAEDGDREEGEEGDEGAGPSNNDASNAANKKKKGAVKRKKKVAALKVEVEEEKIELAPTRSGRKRNVPERLK